MKLPPNGGVPIIGQNAPIEQIPAQLRLNINDEVGRALETCKSMGLRHGRCILSNPLGSNDVKYLLWLDALKAAGCTVVSVTEIPVPDRTTPEGARLQVHVVWSCPDSFFTAVSA